jgi:N-acetyl-gamma-glutamyl-phosphate reductase
MGERVRVAVLGASGYTGAETLRWCLGHPAVEVVGATSRKHAGRPLGEVWPQFGACPLTVTTDAPEADVWFLCLPHGEAAKLEIRARRAIDLSGDHRLVEPEHSRWYGFARDGGPWMYGLPELGPERLLGQDRVANPGCFATAMALALLPLEGRISGRIAMVGLTGSTGSGVTPAEGTHHPSRAENLRPYKVLAHQHVPEVVQALGGGFALDFVPISAPVRRGILVSCTLPRVPARLWHERFGGNPLVRVLDRPPDLHGVLGSPRADIGIVEGEASTVIFCAIDNLCRGAGSQAVANLNLVMGWPMDLGLKTLGPVP